LEVQKDKNDIINVTKRLSNSCGFEAEDSLLQQEGTHIQTLMKQHTIEMPKSYMRISDIAKELGKEEEYNVFFKMFSKFTHPSSFLINGLPEEIQQLGLSGMLIMHTQLYAWDIHDYIEKEIFSVG